MKVPLHIIGCGAVTSAGMTAAQTCAAFRAGHSGFGIELMSEPFGAEQTVARIPTNWRLKRTDGDWIVNMAARAIAAAMAEAAENGAVAEQTVLLLSPPERTRAHPCYNDIDPNDLVTRIMDAAGIRFHHASRLLDGGAARGLAALGDASDIIARGEIANVVLAGVDSLLNPVDLARLRTQNRLAGPDNSQGLIPGEGAAAVCLSGSIPPERRRCTILSVGAAQEQDTVAGERFSQGRALVAALNGAARRDGADAEPLVDYALSNANGERYAHLERMLAAARFYKTRRARLPVVYPAMTVGEIGAASAGLLLVIARDAFFKDYAPGRFAMLEVASDDGLRCAAVLRGDVVD